MGNSLTIAIVALLSVAIIYSLYTTVPLNIEDVKPSSVPLTDISSLKYCKVYNTNNYVYYRDLDLLLAPYPNGPIDACRNNRFYQECLLLLSPTDQYPISRPIARRGNQLYYGYLTGNPGCEY